MSDIKLFRTDGKTVTQLEGHSVALERSLQTLIESQLDVILGIRFLKSEYITGKTHGGRIDTLGIDENGCPCIIEYKRSSNENVINQGLFYLDWLLDHKGEFELLVLKAYGKEIADQIEWSSPRLLCIAGDFTKYDGHAVQQINRNIELIRYLRFGTEFLLLDVVHAVQTTTSPDPVTIIDPLKVQVKGASQNVSHQLAKADQALLDIFDAVRMTCMSFGDDVHEKMLQNYVAFKRLKNFASVELRNSLKLVLMFVKVDPDTVDLKDGFTRDVRNIGHFGTGELEISLRSLDDVEKALPLLQKSYDVS